MFYGNLFVYVIMLDVNNYIRFENNILYLIIPLFVFIFVYYSIIS